jgi:hypothetical protein
MLTYADVSWMCCRVLLLLLGLVLVLFIAQRVVRVPVRVVLVPYADVC